MNGQAIARTALLCNASFSALCGLAFAFDGGAIAAKLLVTAPTEAALSLRILGVGLIGFAAFVAFSALRRGFSARRVMTFTVMDIAWVLATLLTLGLAPAVFTAEGVAAVALVGLAVGLFATGQGFGASRMS